MVLQYDGIVLQYDGIVLQYDGIVLQYDGIVLQYDGTTVQWYSTTARWYSFNTKIFGSVRSAGLCQVFFWPLSETLCRAFTGQVSARLPDPKILFT